MSNRALGALLTALLAVCGFLAWRIWALTAGEITAPPPESQHSDNAAEQFLNAWRTSQTTSFFAKVEVGLTGNGAAAFTEDIVAQHNAQLLINRNGSIIYERDGQSETCRQTSSELFCTPAVDASGPEGRIREVEELVDGDTWSYRVTLANQPDCYDLKLELERGLPTQRFGLESMYCFDPITGALASSEVRRVNRNEIYRASDISDSVEENDLRGLFPEPIIDRFLN